MLAFLEDALLAFGFFLAVRNVTDEADEQFAPELLARGDRQFDRNLAAVAMERADLDAVIEHRAFAGGEVMLQAILMRDAKFGRDEQVR